MGILDESYVTLGEKDGIITLTIEGTPEAVAAALTAFGELALRIETPTEMFSRLSLITPN